MNNEKSIRLTYLIGFILIITLLLTATALEVYLKIHPCPLCSLQRVTMGILGILFFLGMILRLNKMGYLILGCLEILTSITGILLSGRQVWLQHVPPQGLGECGISLMYTFKIFPFLDAIKHVWRGGTECSQDGWIFLNLSLAGWSMIWFCIFFILIIIQQSRLYFLNGR